MKCYFKKCSREKEQYSQIVKMFQCLKNISFLQIFSEMQKKGIRNLTRRAVYDEQTLRQTSIITFKVVQLLCSKSAVIDAAELNSKSWLFQSLFINNF